MDTNQIRRERVDMVRILFKPLNFSAELNQIDIVSEILK